MRWTLMGTVLLSAAPWAAAVWPQPTTVSNGSTVILLSSSFSIGAPDKAPRDILEAIDRCVQGLLGTQHRYLSVRSGEEFFEPSESVHVAGQTLRILNLRYSGAVAHPSILEEAVKPVEQRDESYNLTVPVSGVATLSAGTSLGLLRGLTTFEQLFYRRYPSRSTTCSRTPEQVPLVVADPFGHAGNIYAPFGPYDIFDEPSFGWRSILLDTSRSWFPIADLEKMLDAMSFVKLNVFHWHIVDSHSYPAILSSHPELAATGAYTSSQTYSEDDIQHVICYAGERGIDVVLELDMPGHTTSIGYAYPGYVACLEAQPWSDYAVEPPAGQIRFVLPDVVHLVKDLLHDALRVVSSSYFSTGGDEIDAACYTTDEVTQQALKSSNQTLDQALARFLNVTQGVIASYGKKGVLWQDMILNHPRNVPLPDTIVQVWVSSADAKAVIERGYRVIHAASDYFYLDCGRGNWIDQPSGGNSWCDPYKSWARIYSFDPYTNLTDVEKAFVLGGQASLWTEQTDPTNMETVMWPRAAALAEVFWSGPGVSQYPLDATAAVHRFNDLRYRLVDRGVRASPIQPHWCAVRPGACRMHASP